MRLLAIGLGMLMLASPVAGHELQIYTVIVNSEGGQPADIPNGTLKEGDSVWFWMKDVTENATLVVEVEKDGATARSDVLQFECDLDENGSKVDENCSNRYDFVFNPNNSAGLWNFTFLTYVNDTLSKTSLGSVNIQEDLHDELHNNSSDGDETIVESKESNEISNKTIAGIVALISLLGMAVIVSQMGDKKPLQEK